MGNVSVLLDAWVGCVQFDAAHRRDPPYRHCYFRDPDRDNSGQNPDCGGLLSLSLSVTREKTGVFFLTVLQSDGTAQSLVGLTLYFHAANGNGFSIDKDSPANGIVITDAARGLATLTISASDTASLSPTGVFAMPCELTLVSAGTPYELNTGTLTVTPNVGTP